MKKTILLVLVLALGLTTEVANADFTFGTPTNLGPTVNTSNWDIGPSIPADGLTLYFTSNRPGGYGGRDIWVTTRATTEDDWGTPANLGPTVNSSDPDISSVISADGLSLFFGSNRPGGSGGRDIWVTTRATTEDDWCTPVNLGPTVNSSNWDNYPSISADGLLLFFDSGRPGGYGGTVGYGDILVTTRATKDDDWSTPVNLGPPVNTSVDDLAQSISADGLTLYFTSRRPGGYGNYDIWQAPIIPIVDFNGDGIVDAADMCIMVDYWGTDEPLCDIGPMPWGDGIVDVQDLIVLAEHLFEEVDDPMMVAHWALDETEGDIASDSANDSDGTVYGDPAWQPEGGMVDGALQLDGIGDYVSTPFVLNPADGKFSVFVWIKGGASGQVVLSQQGAANWLTADAEGNLMTELKCTGRSAGPLYSETVITDGQWHRIGLVWDGSHRTLCVDGIAVADDIQPGLQSSQMGLYIGTGKMMQSGTYFSGLIDDVRIYNRAITP